MPRLRSRVRASFPAPIKKQGKLQLPFFVKAYGSIAKRLCTGLQIRVGRFDSGSSLQYSKPLMNLSGFFFFFIQLFCTLVHGFRGSVVWVGTSGGVDVLGGYATLNPRCKSVGLNRQLMIRGEHFVGYHHESMAVYLRKKL